MPREDTIQVLHGSIAAWAQKNPILLEGEHGYEKETGKFKIGDGNTRWLDLEYFLPEIDIRAAIAEAIAGLPTGGGGGDSGDSFAALTAHINSLTPHPVYDDGPDFLVYYQNAKV